MRMMKVFGKDICISKFVAGQSGGASYVSSGGVKITLIAYCAQSNCLLNGQHHEKGSWKYSFKYLDSQKLSYAGVVRCMNIQDTAQK